MRIIYHVKDSEDNRKYLKLWYKLWIVFISMTLIVTALYVLYVYCVMEKSVNDYKTNTAVQEQIDTTSSASKLTECTYSYNGQKICR